MSPPSLSLTCSCPYCAGATDPTTLRLLIGGDQDGITVLLTPGERATCQLTVADRRALAAFLADGDAPKATPDRATASQRGPVPKADRDD